MTRTSETARYRGLPLVSNLGDLHNLLYLGVLIGAYILAFWLYDHPAAMGIGGPWGMGAFVLGSSFMLGWASGVNVAVNFHNHAHRPIFSSELANRWLARVWTVFGGWPAYFFAYAHIEVHHKYLATGRDWTLPARQPDGSYSGIVRYSASYWPFVATAELWREFTTRVEDRAVRRRGIIELVVFLVLWSIPFWIDPLMALLLWVFPHWIGNLMLIAAGMHSQHAGCVPVSEERPYEHSNTCISRLHNITMFNIGYHIAHHEYPNVHWTNLPRLHAKKHASYQRGGGRLFRRGYYYMASTMSAGSLSVAECDRRLASGYAYPDDNPERTFEAASADDARRWAAERSGERVATPFARATRSKSSAGSEHHRAPGLPDWVTGPGPVGWLTRVTAHSWWAWCALTVVAGTMIWGPWVSLAVSITLYELAKKLI